MTQVTCRLTAKNRDQLRNPTLGNRAWATFLYKYSYLLTYLQNCGILLDAVSAQYPTSERVVLWVARAKIVSDNQRVDSSRPTVGHSRSSSMSAASNDSASRTHKTRVAPRCLTQNQLALRRILYMSVTHRRTWLTDVWWCATSQEAGCTQGQVTSQSLWSRYGRHFVCITRHNALSYISCYSNKIESFNLRKCPYDHWLTNKAYLSATTVTNISKSFTYKMATKTSWHR